MSRRTDARTLELLVDFGRGMIILTLLWAVGEGLAALLPSVPLTGSLWGMVFLFALLSSGRLPERLVRRAAAALVRILGLLFVPVGVGIVAYGPLVMANAWALFAAIVVGSLLTMAVVAGATSLVVRRS